MIRITLPLPPSVNALYRNVAKRGRVKTERYNTWLQAAGWALKEQKPGKVEGPYCLWLYCGKPAADGPRYKALGNSMACNVMRWLGRRIDMVRSVNVLQEAA